MIVSVRREHSVSGPTMWCRLHCLHSIFIDQTLRTGQLPGLPSSLPAVSPMIIITGLGRMFTVNNYYNIKHFKYDVKTRSYRSRLSRWLWESERATMGIIWAKIFPPKEDNSAAVKKQAEGASNPMYALASLVSINLWNTSSKLAFLIAKTTLVIAGNAIVIEWVRES